VSDTTRPIEGVGGEEFSKEPVPVSLADRVCKCYQSLFTPDHPEERSLTQLHASDSPAPESLAFLRLYFDHERRKGKEVVERFSGLTTEWEGGRALDFGAGAGGLTFQIRERSRKAVGIDVEEPKLAFARQETLRLGIDGIDFIHYDGQIPLPLSSNSFDCIFCIDVVEHLPTPESFLAEFRRVLRPGGLLLLSFGPPWRHAHGKHMWTKLPGWWTHLLFPRRTVMRVAGFPPQTTYEDLGIHRLTVGRYERSLRASGLETLYQRHGTKKFLRPLAYLPVIREFFIAEVVGVYRKPR
jgi:ubiquinone/menaquinone biosynthesis C-methylase UbiE